MTGSRVLYDSARLQKFNKTFFVTKPLCDMKIASRSGFPRSHFLQATNRQFHLAG